MNLKRNREITIKSWLNQTQITDDNWEIFSNDDDDVFYIYAKDPKTGNELKLKIEKSVEISDESKA